MTSDPSAQDAWSRHLSQALGAIRRSRQLSVLEMAQRMDLARRTYAAFEAGDGQMNIERIMAFAHATDSDPVAIILSVMIGAPELAVRAADNKMLTAFTILLQEFSTAVGDDVARLETSAAISVFSDAFRRLADDAAAHRENSSRDWLAERAAKLGAPGRGRRKR
jgi:transcriptional regulator with XRE-family HTH domain